APTVAAVTTSVIDTAANDTFVTQTGSLVGTDLDTGETSGLTYAALDGAAYVNTPVVGQYGTLTVNNTGTYSYVPNAAAINALSAGNYTDTF
ncbi:VCBS domain-containing protein, partial [Acinetobacter baumannii]